MRSRAADFVEENLKTIFAYALSRVQRKEDAEDLTNDIVLAILHSAERIQNPDAFYGYVWAIAANTYRKFIRRQTQGAFAELDEHLPDSFDLFSEVLKRDEFMRLHREIALLSKEYRECTIAYYYEDLSCGEVAERLGISLEMVKYYLFKTRKILKEGICMEREFGERSFRPTPFEFNTIFSGKFNREYRNLFARKLPGQILMTAYYMPMSVRELAIEMGVASVYLEDELALLEKYNLIAKTASGKYRTNLLIFTEEYTNEFHKQAAKFTVPGLAKIITGIKAKLGTIRMINDSCRRLSDERLLWGLLWPVMRRGENVFSEQNAHLQDPDELYDGATGTNFGVAGDNCADEFSSSAFAGGTQIDENYSASFADFGVLPAKNRYSLLLIVPHSKRNFIRLQRVKQMRNV